LTTYQTSRYSDLQLATLIYLASEERFFRTEQLHVANRIQTRTSDQSVETVFPNSIRILIGDVPNVLPISAKPVSRRVADVSARLQELEQASLLRRVIPFLQGTEYEAYSITVQGSRYISEYLYVLLPLITSHARLRSVLEKVEGFEKIKSWLLELGSTLKDRPLEELLNELLLGIRKFPAIGINLLLVLGREAQSEKQ
jgi:hypothetical protein